MFILASSSTTRIKMLTDAGLLFEAIAPAIDEEEVKRSFESHPPRRLALALASAKARSIARQFPSDRVLGCDSVAELDGERIDKPGGDLAGQLRQLSGRIHQLHSSAVLIEDDRLAWCYTDTATLTVRPLSDAFIADYVARDEEARWCAGGYRIEGLGAQLFDQVEGSWFTILGLPLLPLLALLRERKLLMS